MGLIPTNIKGAIAAKLRTKMEDQAIGERISKENKSAASRTRVLSKGIGVVARPQMKESP
jgi:stage V sporulation protein SpoVS